MSYFNDDKSGEITDMFRETIKHEPITSERKLM